MYRTHVQVSLNTGRPYLGVPDPRIGVSAGPRRGGWVGGVGGCHGNKESTDLLPANSL